MMAPITARPPTIPPTIAPTGVECPGLGEKVGTGVKELVLVVEDEVGVLVVEDEVGVLEDVLDDAAFVPAALGV